MSVKKAIDFYYYLHVKNDDYYVMQSSQNKLLEKTFKENWFIYREYKYYLKHKHVIDELGVATQNMKLTPGQARSVKNKINRLGSLIYDNVVNYEM